MENITPEMLIIKTIEPTMSLRWREATHEEWNSGNFVTGTKQYFESKENYILEQLHKVIADNVIVTFEWHPVPCV